MTPELDALLRALANERRRQALSVLQTHRTLALSDLAEELATLERGEPSRTFPPTPSSHLYVDLYHRYVPALASADLVRYDQERDLVAITDL